MSKITEKLVLNRIIQFQNKNTESHQINSCYFTNKVTGPTKFKMIVQWVTLEA